MKTKARLATGIALGVVATLLLGLMVWLTVVYSGAYNVAATDPHADIVRWSFDTTMHRSVRGRADNIQTPDGVAAEQVKAGAETYAKTCAHCHGAPGVERENWATNMRPEPPELTHAAANWKPRELFWIVKHGIKMSGMPSFEPEHSDEQIWGIAAFVSQLPGMTADEYRSRTAGANAHQPAQGGN